MYNKWPPGIFTITNCSEEENLNFYGSGQYLHVVMAVFICQIPKDTSSILLELVLKEKACVLKYIIKLLGAFKSKKNNNNWMVNIWFSLSNRSISITTKEINTMIFALESLIWCHVLGHRIIIREMYWYPKMTQPIQRWVKIQHVLDSLIALQCVNYKWKWSSVFSITFIYFLIQF